MEAEITTAIPWQAAYLDSTTTEYQTLETAAQATVSLTASCLHAVFVCFIVVVVVVVVCHQARA